jgi:hypothetical protein
MEGNEETKSTLCENNDKVDEENIKEDFEMGTRCGFNCLKVKFRSTGGFEVENGVVKLNAFSINEKFIVTMGENHTIIIDDEESNDNYTKFSKKGINVQVGKGRISINETRYVPYTFKKGTRKGDSVLLPSFMFGAHCDLPCNDVGAVIAKNVTEFKLPNVDEYHFDLWVCTTMEVKGDFFKGKRLDITLDNWSKLKVEEFEGSIKELKIKAKDNSEVDIQCKVDQLYK